MTDRRRRQGQRAAKREAEKKQEAPQGAGAEARDMVFGVVVVGIVVAGAFAATTRASSPVAMRFRDQPTACGAEQPDPEPVLSFLAPSHKPTSYLSPR